MHSSPRFDALAECIFAAMAVSTLQKQLHAGGHTNYYFFLFCLFFLTLRTVFTLEDNKPLTYSHTD